jgi:hypothetical protein
MAPLDSVNNALQYCDDNGLNDKKITIFCDSLKVIGNQSSWQGWKSGAKGELTPRPPKHIHPSVITRYAEAELRYKQLLPL